jgi:putative ABC transport system ATP-binding protein
MTAGRLISSVAGMDISRPNAAFVSQVAQVTKSYGFGPGRVVALADVTVDIPRGSFTAIMGPSGSGKSTLMHVMAGLDTVTSGRVSLGGTDITELDDTHLTVLRRRHVGFVFQSFNLVPTLDVLGNLLLPFELDNRLPSAEEQSWIDHVLASLGLTDRLKHRPHELSGGQQQRVAIGRALSTRPKIIFADEPTGNLDSRSGREVLSLLAAASRDYGQTIAMVTHDALAASRADRVLFLADGHVVEDRGAASAEQLSVLMLTLEQRA